MASRKEKDFSLLTSYFLLLLVKHVLSADQFSRADLAFGGLAHKPWHDPRVGRTLLGQPPSDVLFDKAADILLEDARGFGENDFKIPLTRRTLRAVLAQAAEDAA